jgi:biotin carboxyl carrier protein
MDFDVSINGQPWKVAVESAGQPGRFHVAVKGRRRSVDAAWIDAETVSLISVDEGQPRVVREVGLHPSPEADRVGELEVALGRKTYRAVVAVQQKRNRAPVSAARVLSEGRQTVVAPMPGRIVRVLVAAGERVAASQAVVVVEAMKMENELRSPKDGVVSEVRVQEGTAIEAGAIVVIIE